MLLCKIILALYLLFCHPVHITIVNIEPIAQKSIFSVSFKIFTDDLEAAINKFFGNTIKISNKNNVNNSHELIKKYITHHFKIIINGKEISENKIELNKLETIENTTWIYMDFKITSKIKTLEIFNDLLNNLYPDMTNLLILNWGNKEDGYTFNKNNTIIKIQ
jgi:hypothetical protein